MDISHVAPESAFLPSSLLHPSHLSFPSLLSFSLISAFWFAVHSSAAIIVNHFKADRYFLLFLESVNQYMVVTSRSGQQWQSDLCFTLTLNNGWVAMKITPSTCWTTRLYQDQPDCSDWAGILRCISGIWRRVYMRYKPELVLAIPPYWQKEVQRVVDQNISIMRLYETVSYFEDLFWGTGNTGMLWDCRSFVANIEMSCCLLD